MLGICNGFQALVKLGLVPFGDLRPMDADCATLTFNNIGRQDVYKRQVYSRMELVEKVLGYDFEGYERTIDSHVTVSYTHLDVYKRQAEGASPRRREPSGARHAGGNQGEREELGR